MSKLIGRLQKKSFEIRQAMLDMCIKAGTGHVTSSLSCIDILVALYYGDVLKHDPKNPEWKDRDRFILSKGQASPALYTVLADLGYFDRKYLDRFAKDDGIFGVHLQHDVPGVELTSGSLGLGFGVAAGIALAAKMGRELHFTFALLGDGECYEGSIWETALFASHHRLNNLVAIVDRNYICATDFTENLIALGKMEDKWQSFGWDVERIDGHSLPAVLDVLRNVRSRRSVKPLVVIADTVKGEGIECIANNPFWHGISPKGRDAEEAKICLIKRYSDE